MERQLKTRKVGSLLSGYYKDVWMRSGWEIKFAQFLDCSGIQWEYEPEAFKLVLDNKITNYTPDFYLPEFDYYIEIKGWWRHNSKEKFAKFNRKYKHINIILLQMKELTEMGILCKK